MLNCPDIVLQVLSGVAGYPVANPELRHRSHSAPVPASQYPRPVHPRRHRSGCGY